MADEEHRLHQEVTEEIVSHDDAQLEAYLDGTEPSASELEHTLGDAVAAGDAVPIVVCSAVTGTGVAHVADLVCELSPAAGAHDGRIVLGADDDGRGGSEHSVSPDPAGETLVHVFRTVADPFVGQVAMFKVLSGVVRPGDRLRNTTTGRRGADPGAVPPPRRPSTCTPTPSARARWAPSRSSPALPPARCCGREARAEHDLLRFPPARPSMRRPSSPCRNPTMRS